MEIGILGFGDFGQFMAKHLKPYANIFVANRSDKSYAAQSLGVTYTTPEVCATKDIVILCTPVQNMEETILRIRPFLRPGALVLDVASVKVRPVMWMKQYLPETVQILGTHPLFGPQSGRNGIRGLKIVLCDVRTTCLPQLRSFLADTLGLEILEMTPEAHDREMAYIQGLTHWIARAIREMKTPDRRLATVAYQHLLAIKELLGEDSLALFLTIERENPFAAEVRAEFLEQLKALEHVIRGEAEDVSPKNERRTLC